MGESFFLLLVVAVGLSHCQINSGYKFKICEDRDLNCVSVQCNVTQIIFLPAVRCTYELNGKVAQLAPFPLIQSVGEEIIDFIEDAVRKALQLLGIFQNPATVATAEPTTTRSTTADATTTKSTTQNVEIITINIP